MSNHLSVYRVAYLINQYPKVSHSFIRREIQSLERQGFEVLRFAHRGWESDIVDPLDRLEQTRTIYLLQHGVVPLLLCCAVALIKNPSRWLHALLTSWKSSRHSRRSQIRHIAYFMQACMLLMHLKRNRVQHLHAHFGTNSTDVALLTRILGGPKFSFTVHGPEEFDRPEQLQLGMKIRNAAFVVAVSSFCRSQIYRWVPFDQWGKVKVVRCGLEAALLKQRTADESGLKSNRLVCVGRICEQKGQLILIEASRILIERGLVFELTLAGDGEMRGEIEHRIIQLGLQDKVKITGWISSSQVQQCLLDSRALVLPSFAEGLPVVIMEAMAMSRPVISTIVAGIPELVRNEKTGWLIPAGDVKKLADAMESCLNLDFETLISMGKAGFEEVKKKHFIDDQTKVLGSEFLSPGSPH